MASPTHKNLLEEYSTFLRRVSIFSELEDDSLREVAKKLKTFSLPKGAVLYHEGDPGDALYLIQSGRVRVVTLNEQGEERVLNYLGRGEVFGETALLTGSSRSVTVKIDSAANFLVLYKKDFEAYLKNNPSASYYLSRFLSQRLLAASKFSVPHLHKSELLGFFCDLGKEDWITFMLNLSLALTEQTRRKVLFLDLSPYGANMVESIGKNPIQTSSRMLSSEDLRDPKILEKLTLYHPSGLEIITLPEETFSGVLFQSIPPFMSALRELYDLVVIGIKAKRNGSGTVPGHQDDIVRSILRESDSIFYVYDGEPFHLETIYSQLQGNQGIMNQSFKTVVLGKRVSTDFSHADFVVPWGDQVTASLKKGGRPYLTTPDTEPTQRILNRIARSIGKLQVGIAMGSGAAYGYTIIGMMKVFEREKIPIDFISGTSMGALLGSFFAMGKTAEEVEAIAHTITKIWLRQNSFSDINWWLMHGGILKGNTVSKFLRSVLGDREFKEMQIPFACIATDIITGDGIILREGKVWEAVRCSLSLPMIFRPYKSGSRFFVDGGLVNPVPTSIITSMGADILISVNLTSKASEKRVSLRRMGMFPSKSPGMFNVFFKMLYTMQYQIAATRTDLSHIVIRPDTRNFSWIDFHRAKQIIPLGEEAAEESLTKIKSFLPFFADYCKVPICSPRFPQF